MSKNAFFSQQKSADFKKVCDWSTSSWRNNLGIPWCNNLVPNDLDDVITLWCDVQIVTPQEHVLFTAFGKLMFEYILWYEVNKWFLNDIAQKFWKNMGFQKNDKFPRRATGQLSIGIENMAALRAAIIPLSAKNRRGVHFLPPSPERVLNEPSLATSTGSQRTTVRWQTVNQRVSTIFRCFRVSSPSASDFLKRAAAHLECLFRSVEVIHDGKNWKNGNRLINRIGWSAYNQCGFWKHTDSPTSTHAK